MAPCHHGFLTMSVSKRLHNVNERHIYGSLTIPQVLSTPRPPLVLGLTDLETACAIKVPLLLVKEIRHGGTCIAFEVQESASSRVIGRTAIDLVQSGASTGGDNR